jgi:hypothetical protein
MQTFFCIMINWLCSYLEYSLCIFQLGFYFWVEKVPGRHNPDVMVGKLKTDQLKSRK